MAWLGSFNYHSLDIESLIEHTSFAPSAISILSEIGGDKRISQHLSGYGLKDRTVAFHTLLLGLRQLNLTGTYSVSAGIDSTWHGDSIDGNGFVRKEIKPHKSLLDVALAKV